jgi:hypothetical protein
MPPLTRGLIAADDVAAMTTKVSDMRVTKKSVHPSSDVPAGSHVVTGSVETAGVVGKKVPDAQRATGVEPGLSADVDASKASAKQPENRLGSPPQVATETDAWWKVRHVF